MNQPIEREAASASRTERMARLGASFAAAALLSTLAACSGGGGGGDATASPTPAPTPAPSPTPAPTPSPFGAAQTDAGTATYVNAKLLAAFNLINAERTAAGLGVLVQSAPLDVAADGHSNYFGINDDLPDPSTTNSAQIAGRFGFTGATSALRVASAGYAGSSNETVLSFQKIPVEAVVAALSTPYQRLSLMEHAVKEIGLGYVEPGTTKPASVAPVVADPFYTSLVAISGLRTGQVGQGMRTTANDISAYPPAGVSTVPVIMYLEPYNPVAAELGPWGQPRYPGYPVSIQVPNNLSLSVASFSLSKVVGTSLTPLQVKLLDQNDTVYYKPNAIKNWATILPLLPLEPGATYEANFIGVAGSLPALKTWRFTTRTAVFTASAAVRESGGNVVTISYVTPSGVLNVGQVTPENCGANYSPTIRISPQSVSLVESTRALATCQVELKVTDLGTGLADVRKIAIP